MKCELRVLMAYTALLFAGMMPRICSLHAAEAKTRSAAEQDGASAGKRPSRSSEDPNQNENKAEREDKRRRRHAAQEHVTSLSMRTAGQAGMVIEPVDRPLLAFGDPTRSASHGMLWALGKKGRPAAFLKLWQASERPTIWYQSATRTDDKHLLLQLPDGRRWHPPVAPVPRTDLDGAPQVADDAAARLRQLKALAKRFAAYEVGDPDNSRFELRLLVQPVHRYDDASNDIRDGAVFVFAHGTNPEIVLLLEAIGVSNERPSWQYGAFPVSSAELHVELDGRKVWKRPGAPGVVGLPTDDYWLFSLPVRMSQANEAE